MLSFMPRKRELKVLQATIQTYENYPNWQLYLWKEEEDFVGLIGIEIQEDSFIVLHATVNPSHRNQGIGHVMVEKVQQFMKPRKMCATEETEVFLTKCSKTREEVF